MAGTDTAWSGVLQPGWLAMAGDDHPLPEAVASSPDANDLAELSDAGLVEVCLAGRRAAFDLLVTRHRRAVYQICYRFVNNHEDASDLSQDAFVRAYKGLAKFKGQAAFGTWLYRISVNVCLNRRALRPTPLEPLVGDRFVDASGVDPCDELVRNERAAQVRLAIATLPPKQRATVLLRVYQDLPHEQIAQILGSSVGAVKANFFHALGKLRKDLLGGSK